MPAPTPDDFRRLTEQQQKCQDLEPEEMAYLEFGFMEVLSRRTANRLGFQLHQLSVEHFNDIFFQFLRDRYQERCSAKESWRMFDERLDDILGPELLDHLKSQLQQKKRQN